MVFVTVEIVFADFGLLWSMIVAVGHLLIWCEVRGRKIAVSGGEWCYGKLVVRSKAEKIRC